MNRTIFGTESYRVRGERRLGKVRELIHEGNVTLTGELASLEAACLAQRRVMRVRGAKAVINELSVCSDELREQLCGRR